MRTTLTLDDDVAAMLKRARAKSSVDFKKLVNGLLRAGLQQSRRPKSAQRRYRTPSSDAGICITGSVANIERVLEQVEGAWAR